jgi:histone deacetylase 8
MPVLMLGGGGYNHPNAARAWAHLTSIALGRPLPLDTDIPERCQQWELFGPDFTLDISRTNLQDANREEDIAEIERVFADHAAALRAKNAP